MNILMITAATPGDVQPYVALGKGLSAAGHSVTICTFATFESFITDYGLNYAFMNDNKVLSKFKFNQDAKNKQKKLDHDLDLLRILLKKYPELSWADLNTLSRYTVNFNPAVESFIKAESPIEVSANDLQL